MDNPSDAAQRLMMGLGLGLLLVTGFALQDGRLESKIGIGWIIPISGLIALIIAISMSKKNNIILFSRAFPDIDEQKLEEKILTEMLEEDPNSSMGSAWAKLEERLLSEVVQEEE